MATEIDIYSDEVYPVYFIEANGLDALGFSGNIAVVEETELADMLAIQENFWKLQKKLQDLYRTSDED